MCVCVCLHLSLSLCISLSLYIYIHTYIRIRSQAHGLAGLRPLLKEGSVLRDNGSASLADERLNEGSAMQRISKLRRCMFGRHRLQSLSHSREPRFFVLQRKTGWPNQSSMGRNGICGESATKCWTFQTATTNTGIQTIATNKQTTLTITTCKQIHTTKTSLSNIYISISLSLSLSLHIYIYIYIYTHAYTHIYRHRHIHIYTHICFSLSIYI